MTAPIELLWFIVATPTRGPFNAQIGDTMGRHGRCSGRPALQIADSRDCGAAASCVPAQSREHVAAPWPCPGGGTWGDTATDPAGSEGGMSAEDKLLLKIRICNERPGGNKLLGRTATGLHCRSRLKSCMRNTWKSAIRKKQSLIFRGEKKGKGKHFMFQENEKRASTIGKCTNIYISPFLSS